MLTYDKEAKAKDELHVGIDIPKQAAIEVYNWVQEQDWPEGTELEPLEEYHITLLFAQGDGAGDHHDDDWISHDSHAVTTKGLKEFPPSKGRDGLHPIVLLMESDTIHAHHNELAEGALEAGVDPGPYSGDKYVPHMTIAYGPGLPKGLKLPKLTFETAESRVSIAREESDKDYCDYGCNAIGEITRDMDAAEVEPFEEYAAQHNKADRDSGELADISADEIDRLYKEYLHKEASVVVLKGLFVFGGLTEPPQIAPESTENNAEEKPHTWRIAQARPAYMVELLKLADSWNPKDQWPNALRERNGEPVDADCTCKDGHKLDCPVHGMHPVLPTYDDTLDFPNPASPVGYDYHADGPRTWMRAETKAKKKLWLDDTRRPPGDDWDWARNVAEAQHMLQEENREYSEMSLDHDLSMVRYEGKAVINPDALSGGDFCLWLHEHGDKKHMPKRVTLHTHNLHAVEIMYKALEPHTKVRIEQAPDHLEEDWARKFKVHEPSEIEEEAVHLPEQTIRSHVVHAGHQLAWLPGSNLRGKGLITPAGDVHTWPVDAEGRPHHAEYMDKRQPYQLHEGTAHFFQIRPRGGLDTKGYDIPADAIHHVLQVVPSLRPGEHTDWHFAADQFDTREYPDSRMMSPATMQEPAQGNPHPEKRGCTCEQGHKLDCPVHGLNPTEDDFDHSWSIPENHPVGYPQDQPRNYMKAEGALHVWKAKLYKKAAHRKTGGMTAPQQQRFRQRLEQEYGPEQSVPIHQFPDGWSIHHLPNWGEVGREGAMMNHCWAGLGDKDDMEPIEGPDMNVSLRDPNGWPHASFSFDPTTREPYEIGLHGGQMMERGGEYEPREAEHMKRILDFARSYPQMRSVQNRGDQDDTESYARADERSAKQSAYDGREGNEENSVGIDHEYSVACDCPSCAHRREHSWHVQGLGTSDEGWSGLPRAEGAVDEDEHTDNLEGENVPIPTPPAEIRKKRKGQEDEELVRESPLLHSGAWQILPPVASRQSRLDT
jgi:2'-5' RNA ligase